MNLNQLVALFLLLVIFGTGIAGMTILLDALFARFVRRASANAARMPIRSAVVGAINFIFFSIVAIVALAVAQELEHSGIGFLTPLLRLFGASVILVLAAFIALGIAACARWLGERLAPDRSAVRQIIAGITVLELACLAPLVGWIVVPFATTFIGYGAVIIALVWRRESSVISDQ